VGLFWLLSIRLFALDEVLSLKMLEEGIFESVVKVEYRFGESETLKEVKKIALERAKILASESAGVYIESVYEKEVTLQKEEEHKRISHLIKTLSSAILETKVLSESQKDFTYTLILQARANSRVLYDKAKELKALREKNEEAARLVEELEARHEEKKELLSQLKEIINDLESAQNKGVEGVELEKLIARKNEALYRIQEQDKSVKETLKKDEIHQKILEIEAKERAEQEALELKKRQEAKRLADKELAAKEFREQTKRELFKEFRGVYDRFLEALLNHLELQKPTPKVQKGKIEWSYGYTLKEGAIAKEREALVGFFKRYGFDVRSDSEGVAVLEHVDSEMEGLFKEVLQEERRRLKVRFFIDKNMEERLILGLSPSLQVAPLIWQRGLTLPYKKPSDINYGAKVEVEGRP